MESSHSLASITHTHTAYFPSALIKSSFYTDVVLIYHVLFPIVESANTSAIQLISTFTL